MIYQSVITATPDTAAYPADAGPGYDRLSFSFPYPDRDELIKELIEAGVYDRYFGAHDSVTYYDDRTVSKMTWKTKEAADNWVLFLRDKPGVISAESISFEE